MVVEWGKEVRRFAAGFIAFGQDREKEGDLTVAPARSLCASMGSYAPVPGTGWRSGRVPALPYPPTGQYWYRQFTHQNTKIHFLG
jgi:hypothetical protein